MIKNPERQGLVNYLRSECDGGGSTTNGIISLPTRLSFINFKTHSSQLNVDGIAIYHLHDFPVIFYLYSYYYCILDAFELIFSANLVCQDPTQKDQPNSPDYYNNSGTG
jgi:hypothetical protein